MEDEDEDIDDPKAVKDPEDVYVTLGVCLIDEETLRVDADAFEGVWLAE